MVTTATTEVSVTAVTTVVGAHQQTAPTSTSTANNSLISSMSGQTFPVPVSMHDQPPTTVIPNQHPSVPQNISFHPQPATAAQIQPQISIQIIPQTPPLAVSHQFPVHPPSMHTNVHQFPPHPQVVHVQAPEPKPKNSRFQVITVASVILFIYFNSTVFFFKKNSDFFVLFWNFFSFLSNTLQNNKQTLNSILL